MHEDDPNETSPLPVPVVGIGYSAGGLEALTPLLHALDPPTGLAWVIMHHAGQAEPSQLADILTGQTDLPVEVASDGMHLRPDHICVAPPGQVMRYEDGRLRLSARDPHAPHYEIDAMLASLAEGLGPRCIGVVLSGTLTDGVAGMRAVKAAGGFTLTQNLDTARFADLPAAVIRAQASDLVLAPHDLGVEVQRLGRRIVDGTQETPEARPSAMQAILERLLAETGVDFEHYKRNTLMRRIGRRIAATRRADIDEYARLVDEDDEEVAALFSDLLINVTGFFRDPAFFESLRQNVVDPLLRRHADGPLRIWVPGCATGEEVYSIAMMFLEAMDDTDRKVPLQMFGTDLSETAIQHARRGTFTAASMEPVSKQRRARFFNASDEGFRIDKSVRDACIFAVHDLTSDPPFSNLDLVSCRNVLIYMDRELQKRVFRTFHYALREDGMVALGPSEATGEAQELFEAIGDTRIHRRRPGPARSAATHGPPGAAGHAEGGAANAHLTRMAKDLMARHYGTAAMALTGQMRLVWAQGSLRVFLRDGRRPGRDITRDDLHPAIQDALDEVARTGQAARARLADGSIVQVLPVGDPGDTGTGFLVACEAAGEDAPRPRRRAGLLHRTVRRLAGPRRPSAKDELVALRAYLQHVMEDYEATNEELRTANEEALSGNEELQSTNEELQSAHEELATLNEEMHDRLDEMAAARDALDQMFDSLDLPVVALDNEMRIRQFTTRAGTAMNIIDSDVGRPLTDIHTGLDRGLLKHHVQSVVETLQPVRATTTTDDGGRYTMVVSPMHGRDGRVTGALLILLPHRTANGDDPEPSPDP